MNKMVKRGLSAYLIFLKNKTAASLMMLFSGIMMFIAALDGKGNDTKTLPTIITVLGSVLTLFAFYKFGYLKSDVDRVSQSNKEEKSLKRKLLFTQALETLIYMLVAGVGIYLLTNEGITNVILNCMAGFFTTLNGVFGAIDTVKNRKNIDFKWKFIAILTVFELILGIFFLINRESIDINGYIVMGGLTTVAGVIEVIKALTMENLKNTINDGRNIVHIMKDGKKLEAGEKDDEDVKIEYN